MLNPQLSDLVDRFLPLIQDFHRQGMYAPNAASIDADGEVHGHALTTDGTTHVSATDGMALLQSPLLEQARSGQLIGVAVFFHSSGIDRSAEPPVFAPATHTDDCRALVGILEHVGGDSVYLVIPYSGGPPEIEYGEASLVEKPPHYFAPPAQPAGRRPWWKRWF